MRSKSHHQSNGVLSNPPRTKQSITGSTGNSSENDEQSTINTCLRPLLIKTATTTDRRAEQYWSKASRSTAPHALL